MSNKVKVEDVDEDSFTVLDEVQGDEIDLTYDDDEADNTVTETAPPVIKDPTEIASSLLDEEEGYLNREENNIFGELDNILSQQNDTEQEQVSEVQNGTQATEDPVENWKPVEEPVDLEACVPDENGDDDAVAAPAEIDKISSQNTVENTVIASDFKNEVNQLPEHDDDIEEEEGEEGEEKQHAGKDMTHPYLYLIETFEFQKDQLNMTEVEEAKPIEQTPLHLIFGRNLFIKMIQKLRNATEIAVDYQTHKNDYQGTVCLIMISTKEADYIIDAIKLKHDLLMLTEIFINPKIVKILLHAKKMLTEFQQKLHLYMVNVFDVEGAKVALENNSKAKWALHVLLRKEYNVERNQLSRPDFRQRPLPEHYRTYLRLGTHYLVHMYHVYKNRFLLKDASLYKKFLEDCRDVCKLMHNEEKKEMFQSMEDIMKNHHKCELEVLKKLFDWRASVAQRVNLKTPIILPNSSIINLARKLPTEENEICEINPSKYLRFDVDKLKKMIQESKTKFKIFEKQKFKKQKRKLNNLQSTSNNQPGIESKQRRIENESPKMKNTGQNNFTQNRPKDDSSHNKYKDFSYNKKKNAKHGPLQQNRNFSIPSLMDKKVSSKSFSNKNLPKTSRPNSNNKSRNSKPFDQTESRFSDLFSSNVNLNTIPNSLLLNPTNIPSAFTFQPNPLLNSSMSNRNDFDGFSSSTAYLPFGNQNEHNMSRSNFDQPLSSMRRQSDSNDEENLYKTLVDLKQARDNIRMQAGKYSESFNAGRLQDLNIIDQKISMLEIKIQQMRHGNNRDDSSYKRRYFHN